MFFTDDPAKIYAKKPKLGVPARQPLAAAIIPPHKPYSLLKPEELLAGGDRVFVYDVESYANYWCVCFKDINNDVVIFFEVTNTGWTVNGFNVTLETWAQLLTFILYRYLMIGFNSDSYDKPMTEISLMGLYACDLWEATKEIIQVGLRPWEIRMKYGFRAIRMNHIDLIEVAPLDGPLKLYGARIHTQRLQDLPYEIGATLTYEQAVNVRNYCINDLDITKELYIELLPHIRLREELGKKHGMDLRSKSDAQLAQAIIDGELTRVTGKPPAKAEDRSGDVFHYRPPAYLSFQTPALQAALEAVAAATITVGHTGYVQCDEIEKKKIYINGKLYIMGLGGLHSKEKSQGLKATDNLWIIDRDVTGYYPNLILKNKFAPRHLGEAFLESLQGMVDRRTSAKRALEAMEKAGKKSDGTVEHTEAHGLKIANNGVFGKTSDPFSTVYDPEAMVQTTLSGQFSLLMAVEYLELCGFSVVSANTDGIVTLVPPERYQEFEAIFEAWGRITSLETEETRYKALYSRDVNNYFAVKMDNKVKVKGAYAEKGSALNSVLSANPTTLICADAVQALLAHNTPVTETIQNCQDIRRFVSIVQQRGGAEYEGVYLGKIIRWYYSTEAKGYIARAKSGNKVPKTDGAKPLMDLTPNLPTDLDYDWYIRETERILYDIGYYKKPTEASLFD